MEHDSLLENQIHEGLSEEERKLAWQEFQQERERAEQPPPPPTSSFTIPSSVYSNMFLNENEKRSLATQLKARFPQIDSNTLEQMLNAQVKRINQERFNRHLQVPAHSSCADTPGHRKYHSVTVCIVQMIRSQSAQARSMGHQPNYVQQHAVSTAPQTAPRTSAPATMITTDPTAFNHATMHRAHMAPGS